ncbi:hypothetical protein AK812_SmicGene38070 [Symbiodinium microadriaticum]|uniref:Uncharacterized protein n=1 Tax=Symbiodinium microadriaticum TaxID=2951 RepID=A0A1Q9CEM4_SYMMI|nr:hypothetical protein AK812_SmicGene38070 [Symbiodinium microadriaticum]
MNFALLRNSLGVPVILVRSKGFVLLQQLLWDDSDSSAFFQTSQNPMVEIPHLDGTPMTGLILLRSRLDQHKLANIDCSTDGILTPFCNMCMRLEPSAVCNDQNFCQPSLNHFAIRTTCPRPKYLTESDGNVFFAPRSDGDEQHWRLSAPLGASPPQQSFDFL